MLALLPTTLLALLFASPVFATSTTPNDPFRAISLKVKRRLDNPICCLKPSTPLEPVDDEILLSFEEWKLKQQQGMSSESRSKPNENDMPNQSPSGTTGGAGGDANLHNESSIPSSDAGSAQSGSNIVRSPSEQWADVSPHFRVPITDRFNYASLDCSARVHTSHRSAKSPSSILSSKKDRYMLSPCSTSKEKQFVVVELCDDVRIDTVQMANFEFFSGVFKDFTVSVAKTYTTDPDGWIPAGTYKAKNARGVQSFHPPTTLRDFYRYIRIDYLSHYGNEYYCPVSLLRVYGLTHLEQWKWDIWEAESKVKLEKERQPILTIDVSIEPSTASNTAASMRASNSAGDASSITSQPSQQTNIANLHKKASPITSISNQPPPETPSMSGMDPLVTASTSQKSTPPYEANDTLMQSISASVSIPSVTTSLSSPSSHNSNTSSTKSSSYTNSASDGSVASQTHPPSSGSSPSNHATHSIIVSASSPSVAVIPIPLPPSPNSGESIYRTIMNRLAAVETNQTLYMRYIEQQNSAIRDVIKRLGEDLGRLEGISRAQTLMHQRSVNDWEKQRYQLQMEYGDILERIEILSDEIILEKRLGIAQLCLLLAVLVFLGLTRGSRPETFVKPGPMAIKRSVREWGKRHLSLSGDWSRPFMKKDSMDMPRGRQSSRSGSSVRTRTPPTRPKPLSAKSYPSHFPNHYQNDAPVAFPSSPRRKEPLETINTNHTSVSTERRHHRTRTISNPRSRNQSLRSTPASRRAQHALQRPITPTRLVFRPPPLQRSNSQGVSAMSQSTSWGGSLNPPKSAKKWARTAHLHEVKPTGALNRRAGKAKEDSSPMHTPREFGFNKEKENGFFSHTSHLPSTQTLVGEQERLSTGFLLKSEEKVLADSLLLNPDISIDDGDPWVDTDSVDDDISSPTMPRSVVVA